MSNVIDLNQKLETKKMIDELREVIGRAEKDTRLDPQKRAEVVAELNKGIFRMELLLLCLDRGYEPKEFLINPKDLEGA